MKKGTIQLRVGDMIVGNFNTFGLAAKELMKSLRPIKIDIYECMSVTNKRATFELIATFEKLP